MADNQKYYYLKLKDGFFDQEDMKLLESQENGILYENIYLKLSLLSLKNRGELRYKEFIPYDEKMLSTLCNIDIDHIRCALKIFIEMGLIEKLEDGTIFMLEIESLIGKSSDEAERKANYRKRIHEKKVLEQIPDNVPDKLKTKSTIIKDKDKIKDKIKDKERKEENFSFPQIDNQSFIPEDLIEIINYIQTLKILSEERTFLKSYIATGGLNNNHTDAELLVQIKQMMSVYSISDIKKSADNYKLLLEDEIHYHISSPYTRILSFLAKGVPGFIDLDIAKKRCKKNTFTNKDGAFEPMVKKRRHCNICGTSMNADLFCIKCNTHTGAKEDAY